MENSKEIAILKKLIAENEKSLNELKALAARLEGCRQDSVDRHRHWQNGHDQTDAQQQSQN